jgi:hypothetical protein
MQCSGQIVGCRVQNPFGTPKKVRFLKGRKGGILELELLEVSLALVGEVELSAGILELRVGG